MEKNTSQTKLKDITKDELATIIEKHQHWLKRDIYKWETMQADLSYMNLRYMDLTNIDLSYVNMNHTDLSNANLNHSNLSHTNLNHANLSCTNLNHANLSYANILNTNLSNANINHTDLSYSNLLDDDLTYCNLYSAELKYSNLINIDLSHTNLLYTNLYNTNLTNVNLSYADLYEANLINSGLENIKTNNYTEYFNSKCPKSGSFIGWKKCKYNKQFYIVKLEIPEDALRSSSTSEKCRCNKAKVLEIQNIDESIPCNLTKVESIFDDKTTYELGKTLEINDFNKNEWYDSAEGINFYMTRKQAVDYYSNKIFI